MRALLVATVLMCTASTSRAVEIVAGGQHWRLETDHGPVHVWRPLHSHRTRAGTVVYVHGYYTDADGAFTRHKLAEQFLRSGRDALFIVPEAPASSDDEVVWSELGDLLREVERGLGAPLPDGPLVVAGHSGAYRTISGWLAYPSLDELILLDALYGNEEDFREWLTEAPGHASHRLAMVSSDTAKNADPFLRRLPEGRVVDVRPRAGHMEIVTDGELLPMLLQRARLPAIVGPP